MKTAILDLYFQKGGVELGPSNAQVTLKAWSANEDGLPLVTPKAASVAEFESFVQQLHHDLDELVKEARRRFIPR